jgi:tRNA (cytidine/uridine-2'-O-)-methyltransferase
MMSLHVALIEPRIPPNTGNIMRLCAGADVPLHLIGPVGFSLDEQSLRRAALDYREKVDLWTHPDWFAFRDAISRERCLYFTPDARKDYTEAPFRRNSVLVFGNEEDGMPARIVEKHRMRCFRIPTVGQVRSLNLANAVSVVLYEGLRQLGHGGTAPVFGELEEADEPNYNIAVPVPAVEELEEEDEINYNVEQQPHLRRAPAAGAARPRGRPRRGRGPRSRPQR